MMEQASGSSPGPSVAGADALRQPLGGSRARSRSDEPLDGYLRVYVNDPFGNRLELMEPRSAR